MLHLGIRRRRVGSRTRKPRTVRRRRLVRRVGVHVVHVEKERRAGPGAAEAVERLDALPGQVRAVDLPQELRREPDVEALGEAELRRETVVAAEAGGHVPVAMERLGERHRIARHLRVEPGDAELGRIS